MACNGVQRRAMADQVLNERCLCCSLFFCPLALPAPYTHTARQPPPMYWQVAGTHRQRVRQISATASGQAAPASSHRSWSAGAMASARAIRRGSTCNQALLDLIFHEHHDSSRVFFALLANQRMCEAHRQCRTPGGFGDYCRGHIGYWEHQSCGRHDRRPHE